MNKLRLSLALLSCGAFGLSACGSDEGETSKGEPLREFPSIHAMGGSCGETSSYLSVIENGRFALIVGNIASVSARLDHVTWGDEDELVEADACGGTIYPSLDIELSDVRSSVSALDGRSSATVAFPFEFVESWSPQPIVNEQLRLQWRTTSSLIEADLSSDIRIALLVAKRDDGTLFAYEGWMAQIDPSGSVDMIFADSCEIVGDENDENALVAAAQALANGAADINVWENFSASAHYSFCGAY